MPANQPQAPARPAARIEWFCPIYPSRYFPHSAMLPDLPMACQRVQPRNPPQAPPRQPGPEGWADENIRHSSSPEASGLRRRPARSRRLSGFGRGVPMDRDFRRANKMQNHRLLPPPNPSTRNRINFRTTPVICPILKVFIGPEHASLCPVPQASRLHLRANDCETGGGQVSPASSGFWGRSLAEIEIFTRVARAKMLTADG